MMSATIIVAGALANKPGNGGEAWVRLSWVRGLRLLGFDVWLVEELHGATRDGIDTSLATAWFSSISERFGLSGRTVLVTPDVVLGLDDLGSVQDLLRDAVLLVNISGNLRREDLFKLARRAAYVDLDPGFTQIWWARGIGNLYLEAHHVHFSVGERIGTPRCPIPTSGLRWHPCRQPVLLDDWPLTPIPRTAAFTTVATWRCPFGTVDWAGETYGLKVHEFRKLIGLPRRSPVPLELALSMADADRPDLERLKANGWRVRDAASVSDSPERFRRYVQESAGEFGVAQGVYARANTGWFSDRTVRYLASGRPAVIQDTALDEDLIGGDGLLTFGDEAGATVALEAVYGALERHGLAARQLAEQRFEARRVLTSFLDRCEPAQPT
jgi:hypothetical protein